jgi:putative ABC transport system permease protein
MSAVQPQMPSLDAIRQDLRSARRAVMHARAFTAWVVGSLALGMAVTVAALALLNATLLAPFAGVADQDRLVRVSASVNCGRPDCWQRMSSPSDYEALRQELRSLNGLAAYSFGDVDAGVPEARLLRGIAASANYFEVLGVRPARGRLFGPGDAAANAPVAVLGYAAWTREFGADPNVVGRSIRVGDRLVQIAGIAPPFFVGVDRARPGAARSMTAERGPDLWLPAWLSDGMLTAGGAEPPGPNRSVYYVGRLGPAKELAQVQAEAAVLATRLAASRSATPPAATADVRKVWRVNPNTWRFGIALILPVPILVLLIACVNAANLMTARGSQRQREIAIRLAIGAGRARVVRELLLESAILTLAASAIAVPLAWAALQFASIPFDMPIPIDRTVLGLTVVAAAATTVTFGLAPALRVSAVRPSSTLGTTVGADGPPRAVRGRRVLVIAQIALSLALLATAWQLVATVRGDAVSAGTQPDRLLVARFDLRGGAVPAADADNVYRSLTAAARRLPGVEAAGLARPAAVWSLGQGTASSAVAVWRETDRPDAGHTLGGGYAGGDLFQAVGLRLLAGRFFTDADRQAQPQVAIVNETAASGTNATRLGDMLHVASPGRPLTESSSVRVIGIVEASQEPGLQRGEPPPPRIYLPSPTEPELGLALYVRTRDSAAALAPRLRDLAGRVAARVPIVELATLEQLNERSYATQLWLARAAGLLGIIGVLLATAGLYGVASCVVEMRSREIAIRVAVGASPRTILTTMLGQSMRMAAVGIIAGSGAAAAASRVIQSEYHGVRDVDSLAFAAALALFLAAMLAASAIPAFRAARVDPIEKLRSA